MALRELNCSSKADASSAAACLERAAHSPSLRARMKDVALAPFRLHRYRDVHSMMLRDALCRLDCNKDR